MKQLLILSGKGGTGKTTIASACIKISNAAAFADCDVDAPNLHLVMMLTCEPKHTDYYGMPKAEIDIKKCTACGKCTEFCRFQAISPLGGYKVDPFACEGCGVCVAICPVGAVLLKPTIAGKMMLYTDNGKVFSTAQLKMGSGSSGMLVTKVKNQMKSASGPATELAIIDGSPGIGCPVIASLSGIDMVLIVAEPTISGISDMERIIKTAGIFQTKIGVCVNKYDTNLANTERIEEFCRVKGLLFTGKIPFDPEAVKAINQGMTIVDVVCPSGTAVKEVFSNSLQLLYKEDNKPRA
ncbi:MAG: ATP-binding protein [Negativicutes bacterium]|nr:ATP-binding protein [Negativicutes bacterium]